MKQRQPLLLLLRLCTLATFVLLAAIYVAAQPAAGAPPDHVTMCPINTPVPDGLTIRSVKVTGRRGVGPVEEELRKKLVGKPYTNALHDEAEKAVLEALTNDANKSFEKQAGIAGGAGAAVVYITKCVEIDNASKQVDVTVRVLYLRVDFKSLANNLLSLPRSLEPSFYDKMPAFLRAFDPRMDVSYDRSTGPVASLDLSTDLLELKPLLRGEKISDPDDVRLDLNFTGQKSLSERFYRTKTDLKLSKARPGQFVEQLDFVASFRADDQPLSELRHVTNGLQLGGQIKLRPRMGLLNTVYLSGAFSRSTNKVFEQSGQQMVGERDNAGAFRGVIDGRVWDGFARLGVWFESAEATRSSTSYRRLAGLAGFQREFGRGTQTLGVEAIVGGGTAHGSVPLYARFFGGNNAGSFLYDSPDSPTMTAFPVGPLLRSYGKTQAAARSQTGAVLGAKSYWHANLNFAIPVPSWSRPLIPDETVSIAGKDIRLNQFLEDSSIAAARFGLEQALIETMIEELMKQDPTLSDEAAAVKAAPIVEEQVNKIIGKEIEPIIQFISRRANIFAVKPLVMLDAAQLGGVEGERRRIRFAAGGGLQLVVVVARAEFGYMRSLPSIPGESKGNFVFRLTFQNLF